MSRLLMQSPIHQFGYRRRQMIRATLALTGASLTLMSPKRAQSQLAMLGKLPWVAIMEGAAAALSLVDQLGKLLTDREQPPPAVCKVPLADLSELRFRCREFALTLAAYNYEPVIINLDEGNQGVIPALIAYKREPDEPHWKRARTELVHFVSATQALLVHIGQFVGPRMEWDDVNIYLSFDELQKLSQALRVIEPMPRELDSFWDSDSPASSEATQRLISQLTPLPTKTMEALNSINKLMRARRKTKCL